MFGNMILNGQLALQYPNHCLGAFGFTFASMINCY